MSEEKRIYVVVAEQIEVSPAGYELHWPMKINQPAGRIGAQCAHVVSKARFFESKRGAEWFSPITTIVLSARNNMELALLGRVLANNWIDPTYFHDTNDKAYYSSDPVLTAICTNPIDPDKTKGILDHLPLWSPKCE